MDEQQFDRTYCPHCQSHIDSAAIFCGQCGKAIEIIQPESRADVFVQIRPSLLYYFLTLFLLLVYKTTDAFPGGIEGLTLITTIDVTLVIIFWLHFYGSLSYFLRFRELRILTTLQIVIGAMACAFIVTTVAGWIDISISDDEFYSPYLFNDTDYPLPLSILFICVQPAIFEEVAFRGFLFNNLQQVTTSSGAVYITSFLFGIMHLSFVSLIWLVPLGIISALLRTKYNTLLYGMIAHFIYNATIVLIEFKFF